jgi:hypothetical protein
MVFKEVLDVRHQYNYAFKYNTTCYFLMIFGWFLKNCHLAGFKFKSFWMRFLFGRASCGRAMQHHTAQSIRRYMKRENETPNYSIRMETLSNAALNHREVLKGRSCCPRRTHSRFLNGAHCT